MNFSRLEQERCPQKKELVKESQNPFAPQNPYNFRGSLDFVTPQIAENGWTSPMSPDWPPGDHQAEYAITPLSTPASTPYDSSWSYFDEGFKKAEIPNDTISPTSISFSDDAMDFSSTNPQHGWNPAWNMRSGDQSTSGTYWPLSDGQDRPIIQDPEVEDQNSNTPRAYGYRDALTNSTPGNPMDNTAKPKWGNSKGPRKKHEPRKSGEGSSRGKLNKKDHRRNSSHSSTSSSHHQLRSTKTAQKISYAEPNNVTSSQASINSRTSHNLVEKQYRNRLNDQFNTLLSSIPADVVGNEINGYGRGEGPERRVSKAEVLVLAKRHIETLEKTKAGLEIEKEELKGNVQRLKGAWVNMGGEILP